MGSVIILRYRVCVIAIGLVAVGVMGCGWSPPEQALLAREPADLLGSVDEALRAAAEGSRLSASRNTPSEIIHAGLGLGPDVEILVRDEQRPITVRDYIRRGGPYLSNDLFLTNRREIWARRGLYDTDAERHTDQFLAYFSMMGLAPDTRLEVKGRTYTIADMVATAKTRFDPANEITFTLIALAAYAATEGPWENRYGQVFSLADLISRELEADRGRSACGGTHSLYALAVALNKAGGDAPRGEPWENAAGRLAEQLRALRAAQDPDGSFPARFVGVTPESDPGADPLETKIFSTGHNLEWILVALPGDEWREGWVRRAVRFLCRAVTQRSSAPPHASPWYHALHALRMYRQRLSTHPLPRGPGLQPGSESRERTSPPSPEESDVRRDDS